MVQEQTSDCVDLDMRSGVEGSNHVAFLGLVGYILAATGSRPILEEVHVPFQQVAR